MAHGRIEKGATSFETKYDRQQSKTRSFRRHQHFLFFRSLIDRLLVENIFRYVQRGSHQLAFDTNPLCCVLETPNTGTSCYVLGFCPAWEALLVSMPVFCIGEDEPRSESVLWLWCVSIVCQMLAVTSIIPEIQCQGKTSALF